LRVIYIAGKYRGTSENEVFENIMKARAKAKELWDEGYAVVCPHTNTMFMGSKLGDARYIKGDLEILQRCDVIYMMNGWEGSEGATKELEKAKEMRLGVIFEDGLA